MGRRWRLQLVLVLTLAASLLELTVGEMSNSLTLLSHSFHTLSAALALASQLLATHQPAASNTFGWLRLGLLGALVQGVLLTGLCLAVLLRVGARMLQPQPLRQPRLLVGVGVWGLLHHLAGLYLLRHSSTQGWHPGIVACGHENQELLSKRTTGSSPRENKGPWDEGVEEPAAAREESHLNMRGVFRHVLGGAVGSVTVLANALTYYTVWPPCPEGRPCYSPCVEERCEGKGSSSDAGSPELAGPCWLLYLDPALGLAVVSVALCVARPLLMEAALVLLQAVPRGLDPGRLRARLLRLDGVAAVHELHVWRLAGSHLVATAHVKCWEADGYAGVAGRIRLLFRQEGIRAATVQPEFGGSRASLCELACGAQCASKQCCSGVGTHSAAQDSSCTSEASKRRPKTVLNDATQRPGISLSGYSVAEYETTV